MEDKNNIYTLKSFSFWGIGTIFSMFWILIFIFFHSHGQTSLFSNLFWITLKLDMLFLVGIILVLVIIRLIDGQINGYSNIFSCKRMHFDWNIISIIFVICEEFFLVKNIFSAQLYEDYEGIIIGMLITLLIAVQGFIILQLGISICTKFTNQVFLYGKRSFGTIDTLLSNLSTGTFLVSVIFSLCDNLRSEELMAIATTIININVCMVINKSCFSLFYSPRNREIIEIDQEYQFFSLFKSHKE